MLLSSLPSLSTTFFCSNLSIIIQRKSKWSPGRPIPNLLWGACPAAASETYFFSRMSNSTLSSLQAHPGAKPNTTTSIVLTCQTPGLTARTCIWTMRTRAIFGIKSQVLSARQATPAHSTTWYTRWPATNTNPNSLTSLSERTRAITTSAARPTKSLWILRQQRAHHIS